MQNLDTKLFQAINSLAEKSQFWDRVFVFGSKYAVLIFALILAIYFFKSRKIFWAAGISALLSRGIFTEVIRFIYDRPRPFVALENVKLLIEKNGSEPSFPSGHAAFLFAIALAVFLFDRKIGAILTVVALIFSVARIYTGVHYPFDILGGLLIALVSVFLVRKLIHFRS